MFAFLVALAVAPISGAPPCTAAQIALRLDGRDGDFNGMSHSGMLLILRNRGRACRIDALPPITFGTTNRKVLPITRNAGARSGAGPVKMSAGGVVSTPLRWVSGEVYSPSRCFDATRISVGLGRTRVTTAATAHICGMSRQPAHFDQPPLRPGTETSATG